MAFAHVSGVLLLCLAAIVAHDAGGTKGPDSNHVLMQMVTTRSKGPQPLSPAGGSLQGSMAELEAAVRQELLAAAPTITPEVQSEILARMQAMVSSDLLAALNASHVEDQHEVERLTRAVGDCNARLAAATTRAGGLTALQDAVQAAKAEHGHCRVGQADADSTKVQRDQELVIYVAGLSPPAMPDPKVPGDAMMGWLASLENWSSSQHADYQARSSAAEDATASLSNQTLRCNSLQQVFETASCEQHALVQQVSMEYSSCRASSHVLLNTTVSEVMTTATARRSTWEAASKIVCYIGVLDGNTTLQPNSTLQAQLNHCVALPVNTTFLEVTLPPVAGEQLVAGVEALQQKPGDGTWAAAVYDGLPAAAPAQATLPCPGEATTSTTTSAPAASFARQFGTAGDDVATGIAVHGTSSIYVVGHTSGALFGQSSQGDVDYFVVKYDPSGSMQWAHQSGTSAFDAASAVAVDAGGAVYVAGWTKGNLARTLAGETDYFLAKYADDGSRQWLVQEGVAGKDLPSRTIGLDAAGNVYVGGTRNSAREYWLAKHGPDGAQLWQRASGSPSWDYGNAVAVDPQSGSAFITGTVGDNNALPGLSSSGGADYFLVKYQADGTVDWMAQGASSGGDYAYSVALGSDGQVFVAGETNGAPPGQSKIGGVDAFLVAYSADGTRQWSKNLGTEVRDAAYAVSASPDGHIYVGGKTAGALPGFSTQGGEDYLLAKCSTNGTALWVRQGGSSSDDWIDGLAVDSSGNVYAIGTTQGPLPGQTYEGGKDGFLLKNP